MQSLGLTCLYTPVYNMQAEMAIASTSDELARCCEFVPGV